MLYSQGLFHILPTKGHLLALFYAFYNNHRCFLNVGKQEYCGLHRKYMGFGVCRVKTYLNRVS